MRKRARQAVMVGVSTALIGWLSAVPGSAQKSGPPASSTVAASTERAPAAIVPPPDYVIGPEDQLSVVFWHDKDMSVDAVVRPDGKISLPLLNDIQASGFTPEQLRQRLSIEAKKFVQDPSATVIVRQINSRKASIMGAVEKPGTYPLAGPTTILQFIATAGGLKEYANSRKIMIIRNESGRQTTRTFNYKEVIEQNNVEQNISLRPGDIVIVP
jgi:polysaccharide export outer membrane protein